MRTLNFIALFGLLLTTLTSAGSHFKIDCDSKQVNHCLVKGLPLLASDPKLILGSNEVAAQYCRLLTGRKKVKFYNTISSEQDRTLNAENQHVFALTKDIDLVGSAHHGLESIWGVVIRDAEVAYKKGSEVPYSVFSALECK